MKAYINTLSMFLTVLLLLASMTILPKQTKAAVASYTIYTVNVPIIQQGSMTNWCWAACGASVASFISGNSVTMNNFAYALGISASNNIGRNMAAVALGLQHFSVYSNHYSSYSSASTIKASLASSRPLIAGLATRLPNNDLSSAHMVVIRGIDYSPSSSDLSYMDPLYPFYQYMTYTSFKQRSFTINGIVYTTYLEETLKNFHSQYIAEQKGVLL